MLRLTLASAFAASCSAYAVTPNAGALRASSTARVSTPPVALLDQLDLHLPTFQLLAEIVDADGERVYGAVDAPGWVAPVAGIAAIGTALLPVLLSPGEEAFNQQRGDEETVSNQFGRDRRR